MCKRTDKTVDPIEAIYEKAERDAKYREILNKELEFLGMPWLKAPEPVGTKEDDDE